MKPNRQQLRLRSSFCVYQHNSDGWLGEVDFANTPTYVPNIAVINCGGGNLAIADPPEHANVETVVSIDV